MGSFNRDGVKRRIVEVLAEALPDFDVSYEWPGDDVGSRWLFFGPASNGSPDLDSLSGSPGTKRHAVDTFSLTGVLCSTGHFKVEDAERAAADAMRTVHDTLRRMPRLFDESGAIADGPNTADFNDLHSILVTSIDGPEATRPQVDDEGLIDGMCAFTLTCVAHL
jgi:hypothetical protein